MGDTTRKIGKTALGIVAPVTLFNRNVRERFKTPSYAGETGAGRLFRAAGGLSIGGRALGLDLAGKVAPTRPEAVKKPPLTPVEAARRAAEEKARVTRLRAQAGFSGSDAINTARPSIGGAGGTVG